PMFHSQTAIAYNPAAVPSPPKTYNELAEWAAKNPKKFGYNGIKGGMSGETGSTLPPAWEQMLAQVEQALAATIEAADRREQTLSAITPPPASQSPPLDEGLARLGECVRALTARAEQGEQIVAETDRALAESEEALRAWFQGAEAVRRQLADWAKRA
ncbi:MAG: hypothetical protein L0Z62_44270, partial [Gemmataceae bacterium]|nr:hypothetical protein [Gemmataceae bacterium]